MEGKRMKMKGLSIILLLGITIMMSSTLLVLTPIPSQAEEIRYPVPAYAGEELEKVRQWEKIWVGKRIDPVTIDQVKEFIPESLYQIIKNPEAWGESWFEIVPYREIKPSKGELALTRKYAGTCRIGPNEELLNYVCGIPFPNPETGLEIAYNFDNLNYGDNLHVPQDFLMIDGKNRYSRKQVVDSYLLFFTGRREIPPVPAILDNDRGIYKATHSEYYEPASMRGSRELSLKFIDRTRPQEGWSWSSSTRKLERKSTSQREDVQGGSDFCVDDRMGYDSAITTMRYKYLGRKELLLARHQDTDQLKKYHREGYCLSNGFQRERINTYAVECTHKDPNYLYSKQIWYIDPETWYIIYTDKYDREGRLWRIFDNPGYVVKSTYNNALIGSNGFISVLDVKRLHATCGFFNIMIGETGKYYQPEYYSPKALQKYGY
jgi:hypothetical protein